MTETDEDHWTDCLWASATMFLDAWTRGGLIADREALRAASGDFVKGSNFADLQRGLAAYAGIDLRFSPYGGDRMDWSELLDRLAQGGAAVVLGWYAALPDRYTRWDPAFAARGVGDSGHALFVTDYRADTDELWLMDPLGRGDYAGEWIAAPDLRRFIWTTADGAVYAAATPEPLIAFDQERPMLRPFAGFGFAPPVIIDAPQTGATVELAVPVGDALAAVAARFPHVRVKVEFTRLVAVPEPPADATVGERADPAPTSPHRSDVVGEPTDPIPAGPGPSDAVGERADPDPASPGPSAPTAADVVQVVDPTIQADGLRAYVAMPSVAGLYRLRVTLVNGDGKEFPRQDRPKVPGAIVLVEDHPVVRSGPELIRPDIPLLVIPTPTPGPTYGPPAWPSDPPRPTATPTQTPPPNPTDPPMMTPLPAPSAMPTPTPTSSPTGTPPPSPSDAPAMTASPNPTPAPSTPPPSPSGVSQTGGSIGR